MRSLAVLSLTLSLAVVAAAQVPAISSVAPQNGAPGDQITILGSSFGSNPGSVLLGGTPLPPAALDWKDTAIQVTLPDSLNPAEMPLQVKDAAGHSSTEITFLMMPRIDGLTPDHAAPGQTISVSGQGFGTAACVVLFKGIRIQPVAGTWTASGFKVKVPATLSPGQIQISLNCRSIITNVGVFTVTAGPRVQTPNPTAVAAGAEVTLPGTGFGSVPGTVYLNPENSGATASCIVTSWKDTQIKCMVPNGAATGGYYIAVTAAGAPANPTYLTVLASARPQIQSVFPQAALPGSQIMVQGTGFGTTKGKVMIGGTDATLANAGDWMDTSIRVVVPAAATPGNVGLIVENSQNVKSDPEALTILSADADPRIVSLQPSSAPSGSDLTIRGSNFGDDQGSGSVSILGVTATVAPNSWSNTRIEVTVPKPPPGVERGEVEVTTASKKIALAPYTVSWKPQWGDLDERPLDLQMVGGYEEGYQSAQASASNPFLALYGRRLFSLTPKRFKWYSIDSLGPYFAIRLLQAPIPGDTNNVISVLANPTQTLTGTTLKQVGSAADVTLGLDLHPDFFTTRGGETTGEIILGGGFISPAEANAQQAAFTMPLFGTEECGQMQSTNFAAAYKVLQHNNSGQYAWADATSAPSANGACLINNFGTTSTTNGKTTYAPVAVTTLIYATPDQPSFYAKDEVGLRIINRYHQSAAQSTCDRQNPCARGIVDFTFGQNANITKGSLKGVVLTLSAIHPVPVQSLNFIYFFGTLFKNINGPSTNPFPPLILQPATITSSGSNANLPPNPSTLVVPAELTGRDFYRFGAGINLNQIFTALAPKSGSNP